MKTCRIIGMVLACVAMLNGRSAGYKLFAQTNLVAWCIVPFDAAKRGPEARAAMLEKLRLSRFVYDYRTEHIPTFDAEIEALQRHHIDLVGWWFPTQMNDEARLILRTFERYKIHPQLWVMGGGVPTRTAEEQKARVENEANRIGEIAAAGAKLGCTIGLYNHGGWFGEPENQIAIIERLRSQRMTNIGIVYNLHHGHDHVDRFPELLGKMRPYLLALNLNGMMRDGERRGKTIVPIGQGELDLNILRTIQQSPWRGPIGILNHTDEDAEARLRDNLEGLRWAVQQLEGNSSEPKPTPRSWKLE